MPGTMFVAVDNLVNKVNRRLAPGSLQCVEDPSAARQRCPEPGEKVQGIRADSLKNSRKGTL